MVEINRSIDIAVNEAIIRKAIEITLASEAVYRPNDKHKFEAVVSEMNVYSVNELEVSVLLTDDEKIRRLNKQYRGIDRATDVLAFAMCEGMDAELHPHLLGDIVISVQTAQRQSSRVGHRLDTELALLAVHGTLHLLGYDHEIDSEATSMRNKEEMMLRLL